MGNSMELKCPTRPKKTHLDILQIFNVDKELVEVHEIS